MRGLLAAAALIVGAPGLAMANGTLDGLPTLDRVSPDVKQISPHIPHMGEHWAVPSTLPTGPIYCVIEGRVVCVEYMFTAEELTAGTSWPALAPGLETPPISHIDVDFKPDGIEPMPVPLYQVHIYFVGRDILAQH